MRWLIRQRLSPRATKAVLMLGITTVPAVATCASVGPVLAPDAAADGEGHLAVAPCPARSDEALVKVEADRGSRRGKAGDEELPLLRTDGHDLDLRPLSGLGCLSRRRLRCGAGLLLGRGLSGRIRLLGRLGWLDGFGGVRSLFGGLGTRSPR